MNTAAANRQQVNLGRATSTTGMKKLDLEATANRYVSGGDKAASLWPCKKDHPPHRIRVGKKGKLWCRECQMEVKQEGREA